MERFNKQSPSHARMNMPVLVQIAAMGIITTRCLDLMMLLNILGVRGVMDFIYRCVQTWSLTAIFLTSLVLLFIEFRCGFSTLQGCRRGRWIFLVCQLVISAYLWFASLGYGYPELFSIAGESRRDIFTSLIVLKLPDILVLILLFFPATSRRYFRLR